MEISKELFNEISNSDCHNVFIKDEFIIAHSNLGMKMVNVYEFVFVKCKEWALDNGYYLKSRGVNVLCKESMPKCEIEYLDKNDMFASKDFYSNNEMEAIIKACEYVLKELNEMQNL